MYPLNAKANFFSLSSLSWRSKANYGGNGGGGLLIFYLYSIYFLTILF